MTGIKAQTPGAPNALVNYQWSEELLKWQNLQAEAPKMKALDLLQAWSDLEKYINEVECMLRWNHFRDTTDKSHAEKWNHHNTEVLPQLSQIRADLTNVLRTLDLSELPARYQRPLGVLQDNANMKASIANLKAQEHEILERRFAYKRNVYMESTELREKYAAMEKSASEEERIAGLDGTVGLRAPQLEHQAQVFIELLKLRKQMTQEAGLESFQQVAWKVLERPDCSVEDYRVFRETVRPKLVDLLGKIQLAKAKLIDKDNYAIWDLRHAAFANIDYHGLPTDELMSKVPVILEKIEPEMRVLYEDMVAKDHVDLESRENKEVDYYITVQTYSGGCLMYFCLNDQLRFYRGLFHEMGHVYEFKMSEDQDLYWNRWPDYKFGEVAAVFTDLVALNMFANEGVVKPEHFPSFLLRSVEDVVNLALTNAFQDAVQERIYQLDPDQVTVEDLKKISYELTADYLPYVHRHKAQAEWYWINDFNFHYPFLTLDYTIATVLALVLYDEFQHDPEGTAKKLFDAHRHGGSLNFKDAIQLCLRDFTFEPKVITLYLHKMDRAVEQLLNRSGARES